MKPSSIVARATRPRPAGAAALALVALLVVAPSVLAHAELESSTPAPNASLAVSPPEVSITFTEPIDPGTASIDLVDPDQRTVDGVSGVAVSNDGRTASVTLPELDAGVYTVTYQVISAVDGHATAGYFAFLVDPAGTGVPPSEPPSSTSPSVDLPTIVARWLGLAATLVALGSLLMWWNVREVLRLRLPDGAARPTWPLVALASLGGFAGTTGYLVLAARPIVTAAGVQGFPLDPAAPFGWTPFAIAMRIVLAGTVLAAAVAGFQAVRAHRPGSGWLVALAAALLATALAAMSMAGHAAAAGGPLFGVFDWFHLVAVAAWLGALPAGVVLARRARRGGLPVRTLAGDILRRHARLALVAVPVVALTGIANSPLVLGTSRDLVGSDYGNLLVAKAVLLAAAVGIGAVNHVALRGRRRSVLTGVVAAELAVAGLAVFVAATMVTIQPAAARPPILAAPTVNPAHLFGTTASSRVHVSVSLPSPGTQTYQVSLTDLETGAPTADVQLVFLELTPPSESGLPPTGRVELASTGTAGLYGTTGAYTPVEGDWGLEVVVRRRGTLDERLGFVLPVTRPSPPEVAPPPDTGIGVPGPLAALWPLLPPGALGWTPALVALLALWGLGRASVPDLVRWTVGGALVAAVLVLGGAAGSRAIVAAANAPGEPFEEAALPTDEASLARGEALYLANCAACHGRDGDGAGPVRTLPPAGGLADAVRRMSGSELGYRIANGVAGTPMPAFAGELSADDRAMLVAYLRDRIADN